MPKMLTTSEGARLVKLLYAIFDTEHGSEAVMRPSSDRVFCHSRLVPSMVLEIGRMPDHGYASYIEMRCRSFRIQAILQSNGIITPFSYRDQRNDSRAVLVHTTDEEYEQDFTMLMLEFL